MNTNTVAMSFCSDSDIFPEKDSAANADILSLKFNSAQEGMRRRHWLDKTVVYQSALSRHPASVRDQETNAACCGLQRQGFPHKQGTRFYLFDIKPESSMFFFFHPRIHIFFVWQYFIQNTCGKRTLTHTQIQFSLSMVFKLSGRTKNKWKPCDQTSTSTLYQHTVRRLFNPGGESIHLSHLAAVVYLDMEVLFTYSVI